MIQLREVRKSYGTTVAVDGVSFDVRAGEIFGLLGPNGAGKSTTVALMIGLLAPDSGTVRICVGAAAGAPTDARFRAAVGVAPQSIALYDDLSATENLEFFGRMQGLRGAALKDGVERALAFVGLGDRRRDRVKTFSGGMQRRLNMAAALVHEPQLLLLDEPTVGVDPQSRNAILDNILALKRAGRTVVYTTHYMEEAERLCDRVGIMDHGKLLALDSVSQLIATHGGASAVVFENGGPDERVETADPFQVLSERRSAGTLGRFRVERPDLESVFLHLTGRQLRD
ncbi:MAG: ABC transporter ATP-binding protein [Candidatus Eisenbacteria bacterium]|uniref:ABC transporter ATP-binding protein n=1 Tax=Eiseniibacteriota bacterium TaxID=2212470 RepID=A0A849SDQ5_UNCEI|nr:ABC transporter ATP-binding protein [Candidatus Eisenbacteria bacterium]